MAGKIIRLSEDQIRVLKVVVGVQLIKFNEEKRILEDDGKTESYEYSYRDVYSRNLAEIYAKLEQ